MKRWHSILNPEIQTVKINVPEIITFCRDHGEDRRFTVLYKSEFGSRGSGPIKLKTVEKIFQNNYLESDCFIHNNFIVPVSIKGPYGWRQDWKIIDNNMNWTADFDKMGVDNIKDFHVLLMERGAPLPYLTVQTSQNNFQGLYIGSNKIWTPQTILNTCLLLAGCKSLPYGEKEIEHAMYEGGVDYRYFRQKTSMSKIRIPGTVNTRRDNFVVLGQFNRDYSANEAVALVKKNNPAKIVNLPSLDQREPKDKKEFKRFDTKLPFFQKTLKEAFPRWRSKRIDLLGNYFIEHLKRSMDGTLVINQKHFGKILGIHQSTVSRTIDDLIEAKILRVTCEEYKPGNKKGKGYSKKYGFTADYIRGVWNFRGTGDHEARIHRDYEPGNSNDQKLYDIRALYMDYGKTPDEITDFVYAKFSKRTDKPFTRKQIASEVFHYCVFLYNKYPRVRLMHGGKAM